MGASIFAVLAVLVLIIAGMVWGLAALTTWTIAMATCFAVVCGLLILIVLIQKPKGGGLSGAFGGAGGGSQAAFGAKTGDVLTIATITLFVLFLGLAMGLVWATQPEEAGATLAVTSTTPEAPASPVEGVTPGGEATLKTETVVTPEAPKADETATPVAPAPTDATAPGSAVPAPAAPAPATPAEPKP